ncbi:16S rRNA (uracil(1498)-N(3))-methyltransferase, partial [Candidatus Nomurabacteria bacterium]|nr:16S rRNA (uracil(1498)-N(3))-methyltransferase [Candidatus Nomurabacteria bacterium]
MRLHRFFIDEQVGNRNVLKIGNPDQIHQWMKVFRYKAGDKIYIFDNSGFEYLAEFSSLHKKEAELKILEKNKVQNLPKKNVWLFQSLIKKDNFEWVVEKGTELGVSAFCPVESERSEKKGLNFERAGKIVIEASEQSGRGMVPEIKEVVNLEKALQICEENEIFPICFDLNGEYVNQNNLDELVFEKKVGTFIGPEGGWTEKEINLFKQREIPVLGLGAQVLRAETAAI